MDPLTLSLIMGLIAYTVAPIDSRTLAAGRGVKGFLEGAINGPSGGRGRAAAKGWRDSRSGARKARAAGTDPWSRFVNGVRRTGRGAGRVGDGIVGAARGAGRAARWARDHRPGHRRTTTTDTPGGPANRGAARLADWIRSHLPTTTTTTYSGDDIPPTAWNTHPDTDTDTNTEPDSAGPADLADRFRDEHGRLATTLDITPEVLDRLRDLGKSGYIGWTDRDGHPISPDEANRRLADAYDPDTYRRLATRNGLNPEVSAQPAPPTGPAAADVADGGGGAPTPNPSSSTTGRKQPAMQLREFTNIDDLDAFLAEAEATLNALVDQATPARRVLTQFSEQWQSATWGTDTLDKAVAGVADMASGLADAESLLTQLSDEVTAMRRTVSALRSLGDVAASHGAHGEVRGFQPA